MTMLLFYHIILLNYAKIEIKINGMLICHMTFWVTGDVIHKIVIRVVSCQRLADRPHVMLQLLISHDATSGPGSHGLAMRLA